ncbi:MAG: PPC domain-containing DNA-binding protein [Candidatus Spechtbacterales bacterium]
MELIKKSDNSYILRLDPGEEFISSVQDFCVANKIENGWIQSIGSAKELEIAYFNLDKKDYDTSAFVEFVEILNISGNIAIKDGKPFCHAHGVFGRSDMSTIGGHVIRCVISATAEVYIGVGEGKIHREFDKETNLYLLK